MTPDMADAHETARARDAQRAWSTADRLAALRAVADHAPVIRYATRTHTIDPDTGEFAPIQEDLMSKTDRHDELVALLTEIRDRLPERGVDHFCGCGCPTGMDVSQKVVPEPAPADDSDEALARIIFGDAFSSHEGLRAGQLDIAHAAREHIEAEEVEHHPVGCGDQIRDVRDGSGYTIQLDGVLIAQCDTYGRTVTERSAIARAEQAEAERDALRERHEALRADVEQEERTQHYGPLSAILTRDDERAAKGGQR